MNRQRISVVLAATLVIGAIWSASAAGPAGAATLELDDATFEWTVSDESNTGAFNGDCNFLSAGVSDGLASTYRATDRNATVVKLDANGNYAPISDYTTRCRDAKGVRVTSGGTARLGQKVVLRSGTGTVDTGTGASEIRWEGGFSLNYYGHLTPFWFLDPVLRVDANGNGTITATVGGYASSIDNPDERTKMPDRANVVIAVLKGVKGANSNGFVVQPTYAGVTYDSAENPQVRVFDGWGSWPGPVVDYMSELGLGAYFYSTGGSADPRKRPDPVVISYGTGTAPVTTTTTTVAPGSSTTVTVPPTTQAPTTTTTTTIATTTTTTPVSGSGTRPIEVVVPSNGNNGNNGGNGNNGVDVDGETQVPGLPANTFSWTIDAAAGSIELGEIPGDGDEYRFGGSLGKIKVVDTRNGAPAWTLSGQVSAFTGGLSGKFLGWTPRITTAGAGALPGDSIPSGKVAGSGLSVPALLASAPAGHAPGSAEIDADLDLRVPRTTPGGSYVGTLTITALG